MESPELARPKSTHPVTLADKLETVPAAPGCYLMRSCHGAVIYVGKAKSLRSRVRSYFQKGADLTRRKRQMVREVADVDWIVTDSELEALILESNLIKKHHPTYNVRLRDDKSYPYIAVTLSEKWPRVAYMRKLRMQPKEKDRYFGPYTDTDAVKDTLRLIRRLFRVPCGYKDPDQSWGRACMYHHIGQCTGVCAGLVSREEYMAVIRDVMAFLEGRREELARKLLEQMEEAAAELNFEKAARLRDQVQAIQKLVARQKVISTALEDQDVIALVIDDGSACAEMFFIRGGKLIGQEHFLLENASADDVSESLQEFIERYYENAAYVPREVLLSADIDEMHIIESWLRRKRGARVDILSPKRGEKRKLVEMARKNAELVLRQFQIKMATDEARIREELEALRDELSLDVLPRRIEAYDISNIQGCHTVASLVVFEDGRPKKEHYRKFRIKRPNGMPDDYASMREAVSRRLTGALRRSQAFENLPDLMLIDGGKGQLNAALEAVRAAGTDGCADSSDEVQVQVIGLAKENEEIYKPETERPILLPRDSKALRLVQRARDEAHRFAVTYHRGLRGKAMKASILSEIPGIGPRRMRALLRSFGTVENVRSASIDDLAAAPSMNRAAALAVHAFFHGQEGGREGDDQ